MSVSKPKRMYHRGLDKHGDIIEISDQWVTARLDGDKGTGCWEVDAPYIEIFIRMENLKPEPLPKNPLAGLLKDKERLDFLLNRAYSIQINEGEILSSREEIDKAMEVMDVSD